MPHVFRSLKYFLKGWPCSMCATRSFMFCSSALYGGHPFHFSTLPQKTRLECICLTTSQDSEKKNKWNKGRHGNAIHSKELFTVVGELLFANTILHLPNLLSYRTSLGLCLDISAYSAVHVSYFVHPARPLQLETKVPPLEQSCLCEKPNKSKLLTDCVTMVYFRPNLAYFGSSHVQCVHCSAKSPRCIFTKMASHAIVADYN